MKLKALVVAVAGLALIGSQVQAQSMTVAPKAIAGKPQAGVQAGVQRATSPKGRVNNATAYGGDSPGPFGMSITETAFIGFGIVAGALVYQGVNKNSHPSSP